MSVGPQGFASRCGQLLARRDLASGAFSRYRSMDALPAWTNSSRRLHGSTLMNACPGGRFGWAFDALGWAIFGASLLVSFSPSASAATPDWYADVQYLTWNETMAAPGEGESAAESSGEVQIQA